MKKKKATEESSIKFSIHPLTKLEPVDDLTPDPDNPRLVKKKDLDRLATSLKENPNMLMIRPVVYVVIKGVKKLIGGDKRYKAWVSLGQTTIPAIDATKLSQKERSHFLLWDNENVGTWDFPALEQWGDTFGIALPDKKDKHRFNDDNAEMPVVPKYDEKYRAVMIVVENEMDFSNLCTLLGLGKAKDYKTTRVKQTQVISLEDFMKQWKKKSKS